MDFLHFQRLHSCLLTLEILKKEERKWFLDGLTEVFCLVCGEKKSDCDCNNDLIKC